MSIRFRSVEHTTRTDIRLLPRRDHALVRLVNRSKAATNQQLAGLSRSHLRKVQQRTRLLWHAGLLEQATLPPRTKGRSPLAHRLTPTARKRLGYSDRRAAGIQQLQHRLDTVQAVCALARATPQIRYPVQAWLTEEMARDELGGIVRADSIVVLQLAAGSGVLCLEIDEATQHAPTIRRKLVAYQAALAHRRGWQLLFVVPSRSRREWLRRQARADRALHGWTGGWVTDLPLLDEHGLSSPTWPLLSGSRVTVADLADDARMRVCPTPVGSREWLDLLGSGGGEDFSGSL